jgi:hypothetical protein
MSMAYLRKTRNVPAYRGGRVRYDGQALPRFGTITSEKNGYLMIRLDGDKHPLPFHPTWKLTYLEGATE